MEPEVPLEKTSIFEPPWKNDLPHYPQAAGMRPPSPPLSPSPPDFEDDFGGEVIVFKGEGKPATKPLVPAAESPNHSPKTSDRATTYGQKSPELRFSDTKAAKLSRSNQEISEDIIRNLYVVPLNCICLKFFFSMILFLAGNSLLIYF